jgi:hypothetical protein
VKHADDVRSSRGDLPRLDLEAGIAALAGHAARDLRFTAGAGHELRVLRVDRHEVAKQVEHRIGKHETIAAETEHRGSAAPRNILQKDLGVSVSRCFVIVYVS